LARLLDQYLCLLRLLWRLSLMGLGSTLLLFPIHILKSLKPHMGLRLCAVYHRYLCWCFDIRVRHDGRPAGHGSREPVLYVINHISWLDIVVLGGMIRGCFVARGDLQRWPVFGKLADLQRTIYVDREARHRAGVQRNEIVERLLAGDDVLLFPEGTSGSGTVVLPFKSALFGIIEDPRLPELIIQPVTLSYTGLNGLPMLRAKRDVIAWVGDIDILPHIQRLLAQHSVQAEVLFHPPVRRSAYPNRKQLARACEAVVAQGLELANRGRCSADNARRQPVAASALAD
jgi:lyso-ornithine lipid O-acyltransferase